MDLITGAGGMIGSHMADFLAGSGRPVAGTYYMPTTDIQEIDSSVELIHCDIRDSARIDAIVRKYKPERIFHLAAQSYPAVSWDKPLETMEINAGGTINIFEAVRRMRSIDPGYDPIVVVACSSAEYGEALDSLDAPAKESTSLKPLHPYGVSKVAQDLLAYQYFANYGIRCIRARIFNTTGTRKVGDVCSDFVRRVVACERAGKPVEITVGNLDTKRAIMDVADTVSALLLLADKGIAGEEYNISSRHVYKISEVLGALERALGREITAIPDPGLFRPTDEKIIVGDVGKLAADTGWTQRVSIDETLSSMLAYWRNK